MVCVRRTKMTTALLESGHAPLQHHRDRQHILPLRPKQISNQTLKQKKQSPQTSLLYGGRSPLWALPSPEVGHFKMITLGQFENAD